MCSPPLRLSCDDLDPVGRISCLDAAHGFFVSHGVHLSADCFSSLRGCGDQSGAAACAGIANQISVAGVVADDGLHCPVLFCTTYCARFPSAYIVNVRSLQRPPFAIRLVTWPSNRDPCCPCRRTVTSKPD